MKILDIMLDLETFGVGNNPVIIQLSAVPFNLETGEIYDEGFDYLVEPMSCVQSGLKVTGTTVEWWLKQNMSVIDKVFIQSIKDGAPLKDTLINFGKYINHQKTLTGCEEIRLWGNGLLADNKWLESSYEACNLAVPWKYHEHSDVRTLVDLGVRILGTDLKKQTVFEGEKHNAIDDCKHQIKYCCAIYRAVYSLGDK